MTIPDALGKLIPVIRVTLDCYANNRELFPLQNAIFNLQMSTYWLKEAEKTLVVGDDLSTGAGILPERPLITSPTLLTAEEHFDFIKQQLNELHLELEQFSLVSAGPMTNKLQQSDNRLMEALFSIEIATHHYEQLKRENYDNLRR